MGLPSEIQRARQNNKVTLISVQEHTREEAYEHADKLVRMGASAPLFENIFGIREGYFKEVIRGKEEPTYGRNTTFKKSNTICTKLVREIKR